VVYCCLETPDRSAAPYAHQVHKKPMTLGVYSNPAAISVSSLGQFVPGTLMKNLLGRAGRKKFLY
jgi:hypothetical protein